MKRKYLLFILVTIFTLASGIFVFADHITYIAKPTITNFPSEGKNVIAFGDSLTYGLGSTKGNDYVSQLSKKLETPIMNKGIMGDTTAQALARINDVLKNDPKTVIVYLGGNDLLQGVPADTTFANISQIIEKIQEKGAIVVLVGVRGGILSDPYKARFESLAKRYRTAYVPDVLINILGDQELLSSDSIHPNDKGYQLISETLYKTVKGIVE